VAADQVAEAEGEKTTTTNEKIQYVFRKCLALLLYCKLYTGIWYAILLPLSASAKR
jgi:hypothetical protein